MIPGLLVLVLEDIVAQPGKFSGLAFVIVLSLELVFLVFCLGESKALRLMASFSGSMSLQFS